MCANIQSLVFKQIYVLNPKQEEERKRMRQRKAKELKTKLKANNNFCARTHIFAFESDNRGASFFSITSVLFNSFKIAIILCVNCCLFFIHQTPNEIYYNRLVSCLLCTKKIEFSICTNAKLLLTSNMSARA